MVIAFKILAALGLVLNAFLIFRKIGANLRTEDGKEKWAGEKRYMVYNAIVGLAANFLDVFGIGSYATTSAAFKFGKSVQDGDIPGTLNVGDAIPMCAEAFLFVSLAEAGGTALGVDGVTLGVLTIAAVIGALLGAKLVTKLNIQGVRLMMGIGMIILGVMMALRVFSVGPFGLVGDGFRLTPGRLVIAAIVQLILGMLMNIGVGLYAPCMALCCGLGLSAYAALPVVMCSSAMLMAFGSSPQFIRAGRFNMNAVICQIGGGLVGVCVAYLVVKSLDVRVLTMIITVVVLVTAVLFFRDYQNGKPRRRKA